MAQIELKVGHTQVAVVLDEDTCDKVETAAKLEGITPTEFLLAAAREKAATIFLNKVGHTH